MRYYHFIRGYDLHLITRKCSQDIWSAQMKFFFVMKFFIMTFRSHFGSHSNLETPTSAPSLFIAHKTLLPHATFYVHRSCSSFSLPSKSSSSFSFFLLFRLSPNFVLFLQLVLIRIFACVVLLLLFPFRIAPLRTVPFSFISDFYTGGSILNSLFIHLSSSFPRILNENVVFEIISKLFDLCF